jgi:hypothetical protein
MTPEQADALQRIAEFGELQSALERGDYFERQFNAEADELKRVRARLAEAERLLIAVFDHGLRPERLKRIEAFLDGSADSADVPAFAYPVDELRKLVEYWDHDNRGGGRDPYEVCRFLDWLEARTAVTVSEVTNGK